MTWFAQSANQSEAALPHARMFLAADFDFSSGHVRTWTGWGNITINGQTYTGVGTLGEVSVSPDHVRLVAERWSYRLSGVDPSLVPESDIDACFGRDVTEYFGFLTEAGQLVATPEINREGRMDGINRADSDEPYIEVQAENRMALLDRTNGWRYTHEHQQSFFAGDDGLKLVASTMTAEITWGGKSTKPGVVGSLAQNVVARVRSQKG
jgi:hypothetical protein